jgi:two-component system, OmpR family, alkaline phosphatase synthesis response regulator PhoP
MSKASSPSTLNANDESGGAVRRESALTRSMDTVLVVEDSQAMQRALRRLFEADALQVELAADGQSGLEHFRKRLPCAVVLDLNLPGISGKQLCREFKALAASVPIVVVSANSDVDDKVLLLELGADDYVTKPFSPRELLARVRRSMRRIESAAPIVGQVVSKPFHHEVLTFGDAHIDFTSMEAMRAGKSVTLTMQEFKLLKYLAESADRVVSRRELLNEVLGCQNYLATRTVDNYVLRLRQKLEPDPATPRFLLTMRGAGYKFTPGGSAAFVERTARLNGLLPRSPIGQQPC